MIVAAALSLVDALWVFSPRQFFSIALRVGTAVFIGTLGGLFGGLVGAVLFDLVQPGTESVRLQALFRLLGWFAFLFAWTITGTLIGASVGTFDVLSNVLRGKDIQSAVRKTIKGVVGGAIGGAIGGALSLVLGGTWGALFAGKPPDRLWSPSATGFIMLGGCIGLLIGLAQIILKEAWIRVEQGFRRGREMLLQKGEITLGRAESCDIGLFGDPLVDKLHARILRQGDQYVVIDAGSMAGTFVNDQRIVGPTPLRDGDTIRLGKCVLRFGERAKRQ
jgi:MFS family permease